MDMLIEKVRPVRRCSGGAWAGGRRARGDRRYPPLHALVRPQEHL